jgi:CBS-domain-containing membrane protein
VRLAASALAMAMTILLMALLRAKHPPAASTTLLFAEGSYRPAGHDVLLVVIGVALTVLMGELLRLLRRSAMARVGSPPGVRMMDA